MPKLTRAEKDRLPSTLGRSDAHAQEIFVRTLESAEHVNGHEGDAAYAHRAANASLKHSYEKVGDHWEPKETKGPSDSRAESGGPHPSGDSAEGVDANATKAHLLQVAQRLNVAGRSRMTKAELVEGIERANRRESARARRQPGQKGAR